ncbi:hypothetical protein UFOVP116_12 [uncultured Caudovirales phage]|uniref:Uncharacterized protein n=1 Tax=uncultured Caudovirales phage TaxID=2100421 RepID=A0A6J5L553_9CAUD|nr:hypothetical protein UFOVP116_12 [uncultured Caudovirales phage]
MQYKIISSDKSIGQIQVEYSVDGRVIGVIPIDVPVVNGAYISGVELDQEIRSRAPIWVLDRMTEVKDASGFPELATDAQQTIARRKVSTIITNKVEL